MSSTARSTITQSKSKVSKSKPKGAFAVYGKAFQEKLAQMIVEDRPFSDQIQEVLDINFFEPTYLQVFVGLIFDYKAKYKSHPSKEIISSLIRSSLEDETDATKRQLREFFARALSKPVEDSEYVKEVSLDFCKKQKLKEAILKSIGLLESSSYENIKSTIDDATKLGIDNNHGHDYKKDFEERYQIKARSPISTGWKRIDDLTRGGLGKGELTVVVAPSGAGKSMALVHLGASALKQGKTVIHYTLELSDSTIGLRYDSCITGVPLADLHSLKDRVKEDCINIAGELFIKEYPTKSATTNTIRSSLDKLLKRNKKIDMVIIDYADILKGVVNFKEKRNELESIYEDLRAIAQEYECSVVTASQTNRSGLTAEVITMESISEAFNKCFVADLICTISRTIKDRSANTGRMFVAKNRNGPDGIVFPLFMDTSNVEIKVLEPGDESVEEIQQNALKNQQQDLKEKYKNWRGK